jgi:prolipoprotein diacylglyceryl transferase
VSPLALLPSPSNGVWQIGPVPVRAYALTMIAAIVVASWIGARRLAARGQNPEAMWDIALWAVPFGIVGARIYQVVTSPAAYFGPGGNPVKVFAVWEGGLGVWGAIALGAVGALIGAKRTGVPVGPLADSLAPALAVAQAIGRLGNWFNQELFGAPTTLPWGLQVSPEVAEAAGFPPGTLFQPTFLYEALWDLGVAAVLIWAGTRLAHGQAFFAYMTLYCLGRVWIEALRIDPAQKFLGLRLNVWTSVVVGLTGAALFVWSRRRRRGPPEEPGQDQPEGTPGEEPEAPGAEESGADEPEQPAPEATGPAEAEGGAEAVEDPSGTNKEP